MHPCQRWGIKVIFSFAENEWIWSCPSWPHMGVVSCCGCWRVLSEGSQEVMWGSKMTKCHMHMLRWPLKAPVGRTQTTSHWWSRTRWLARGIGQWAVHLAWLDSWPCSVHVMLSVTASRFDLFVNNMATTASTISTVGFVV